MRKQRSRQQILNAAIVEFEIHGVDAVSMDALAKAAGLTRATVYNLFDSKDQIAAAIVQQQVGQWSDEFRQRMAADEAGLDLLMDALFKITQTCERYPKIALKSLTKPQTKALPEVHKGQSFRLLILDIIKLCQQQGHLRSDQEAGFLMLLVLGIHTQMMIFAITSGKFFGRAEIKQLLKILGEGIGERK